MENKYDNCRRGDPKLNAHLERTTGQPAQSHKTADPDRDWPGMYDLARTLTGNKSK